MMGKTICGLLLMGVIAACSTTSGKNQAPPLADASAIAKSFPHGSGTWHFFSQRWDNGIHFCEYMSGRDKIITRIENFEACPGEVTAP